MASLMTLPREVRLQIWRYILPYQVDVSLDEYIARLRVQYPPHSRPVVLQRIAYANTTAADLRVLCRQIYIEVLSIRPPVLCPRICMTKLHFTIMSCSDIVKQSLRRVKVLNVAASNPTECLRRHFEEVNLLAEKLHHLDTTDQAWMTFAVGKPYSDTRSWTQRRQSKDRYCCSTRYRPAVVFGADAEYWHETESEGDVDESSITDERD